MKKINTVEDFKIVVDGYIQKKLQVSLLLLLTALKDLDNDEFTPECMEGHTELFDMKDVLAKMALEIEQIMESGGETVEKALTELFEIKKKLMDVGDTVFGYNYAKNLTVDTLIHFNRIHDIVNSEDEDSFDILSEGFIGDCIKYVKSNEAEGFESQKKADIISCFPLRMARQKYSDYVKSGLRDITNNLTEENINDLIRTLELKFYPFSSKIYGRHFKTVKKKIEDVFYSDFDAFSSDDFDKSWDEIEALDRELYDLLYYLDMILETVLYLSLILSFVPDFDFLFEDNIIYKDIYFTFKENYNTENFEIILDAFIENLEDNLSGLLDECMELEKMIDSAIDNLPSVNDKENKPYLNMYRTINSVYSESLSSICLPLNLAIGKGKPADKKYADDSISGFLEYTKTSVADMKNSRQKLIRQIFMNTIPCHMPDKEFYEYLNYTLSEINSVSDKLITVDNILKVFEKNGFAEEPCEHHHDHSHSCK